MTLDDKVSLLSGEDFWNLTELKQHDIGSIMVADGPHGLRKQPAEQDHLGVGGSIPATCFPPAVTSASSWDRDLLYAVGQALGDECRTEEVSVLLGPGLNIKRSPLCGRNFEYFSEDPYLSGHMAASLINGIQNKGIGACMKHFAANNQEYFRFVVDTIVDERTLREIYLSGFEMTVRESMPWTVMCSYNMINGVHSSDNTRLLTDILRKEWGYTGLVMTDWGAMNDRVQGVRAGLDLEMPGSNGLNDRKVAEAVRSGELSEELVDRSVRRVLELVMKSTQVKTEKYTFDTDAHHELARRTAEESMVLLRNEENILPLKGDANVAVIGDMARDVRIQGAGSSQINPTRIDIPFTCLCDQAGRELPFARGYDAAGDSPDRALVEKALATAENADAVIVFAGLTRTYESEGFDREHMRLPQNQTDLINALADTGKRIIVVLTNGSPVEMPWIDKTAAVLEGYLGGQGGGYAIARILYGAVNPSGKLAETFPVRLEDTPCYRYFPGSP
ncbi:MAG: glycoside hydrolase family 3 C-terminal domain-containing protein, partial [Spirochaetota bacterium]